MRRYALIAACLSALFLAAPASAAPEVKPAADTPAYDVKPAFTQEQAQVLINMLDVAVKARGIEAAAAGALLSDIVGNAILDARKSAEAATSKKK